MSPSTHSVRMVTRATSTPVTSASARSLHLVTAPPTDAVTTGSPTSTGWTR